jgi:aspartate aminotransferase-like enzyme
MATRGPEFRALAVQVLEGLQYILQTKNDIAVLPGSGSGAMEAAIVNLLSPGDRVLALSAGFFGQRFVAIARAHGMRVDCLDFEWGRPVELERVRSALRADKSPEYRAILVTHNETSTGVTNDVEALSKLRREVGHGALLIVDAVSSVGCINLPVDEWELDAVVTGVQKGLMLPPGLAIAALSERAWEAVFNSTTPRWYWALRPVKELASKGRFPYTPPQSLFFALAEAAVMFREEGLQNVFERHRRLKEGVRAAARALGLALLAADEHASNSVTAVRIPAGLSCEELSRTLRTAYGVSVGGGLGKLAGRIFRIGHMGALHEADVFAVMGAMEAALLDLGVDMRRGSAISAAREAMK